MCYIIMNVNIHICLWLMLVTDLPVVGPLVQYMRCSMTNVWHIFVWSPARPQKKMAQSKVQSIFSPERSRSRSKIGMSQSQRKCFKLGCVLNAESVSIWHSLVSIVWHTVHFWLKEMYNHFHWFYLIKLLNFSEFVISKYI